MISHHRFSLVLFIFSSGGSAISQFGRHFFDSLDALTRKCISKRDGLMKELLETKSQVVSESGNLSPGKENRTENPSGTMTPDRCGTTPGSRT